MQVFHQGFTTTEGEGTLKYRNLIETWALKRNTALPRESGHRSGGEQKALGWFLKEKSGKNRSSGHVNREMTQPVAGWGA